MQIEVIQEQGDVPVTVLQLTGDLTAEEPLLSGAKTVYSTGARNILLDLSQVPYISSAGLRTIHSIYIMLRDADPADSAGAVSGIAHGTYKSPHLKLLSPTKNATKALSVAGYDMFLDIFDNYQTALASYNK
ncbi:MAG: STAS domain-containing protein [Chloroflexota bacterium]